jgi:hypothetical protein
VIWDFPESDERDRGAIFAALKAKLVAHMLNLNNLLMELSAVEMDVPLIKHVDPRYIAEARMY